jgi:hypothetical protein
VQIVVVIIALMTAGLGALGLLAPGRLVGFVSSWQSPWGMYLAAALRLALGLALLFVAPGSRAPGLLWVLGVIAIVAGFAIPLIGLRRFRALLGWWLDQNPIVIRCWGGFALAFGLFLIYAVTP